MVAGDCSELPLMNEQIQITESGNTDKAENITNIPRI